MERGILYTLSGLGLATLLTACGSNDNVISPLAGGAAGSVAAVGTTEPGIAGDTAAQLAQEGNASTPSKPASSEPFSLREGEQLVSHTVVKGDTLSGLSTQYSTRVSRIQAANNMTGTMIKLGDTINIPTKGATAAAPAAVSNTAPAPPQAQGPSASSIVPAAPAVPSVAPAVPSAAPATPSGFATSVPATPAPSTPAPAAVETAPAPAPAPAPAAPAPTGGLPSFNIGTGLQIQD